MNFCSKVAGTIISNAIVKEKTANNVVVSPLGFNIVLNMVAKNLTGPSSEHLCQLLQLNNKAAAPAEAESDPLPSKLEKMLKMRRGDGFTLRCVNKALHDKAFPLQPSFHQLVTQEYKSEVEQVDFRFGDRAIVASINSWVEKQTEGLLSNILNDDDVDSLTRLVLVNALYFKGKWSDPFDPDMTEDEDFHLLDGKTVKVPFMTGCDRYYHGKIDNFDLIRIPYLNNDVSMYIFLPNETQEFQEFLHKIGSEDFLLDQDFKLKQPSDRDLYIPKFDIKYHTAALPDVLSDIVKTSIRNTPLIADNIVRQPAYDDGLFLGYIIQNSVIKVDEAGTEAASATYEFVCGASPYDPPPPPPPIVVDRPFMFMIREEKSKLILFLGAVTNPLT